MYKKCQISHHTLLTLYKVRQRDPGALASLKPTEKMVKMILDEFQYVNGESQKMQTKIDSFATFKH